MTDWQKKDNALYRKFELKSFEDAIEFINQLSALASAHNHHPKIVNEYNVVELWLTTHSEGGIVTDKDQKLASAIDLLLTQVEKHEPVPQAAVKAKLYTDGGSRGNPGPSAIGYVIYDKEDQQLKKEGRYIGLTTNNQAEYLALKEGLIAANQLGVRELEVFMDSLLVVNQMKGLFKVKNRDLWPIYETTKELCQNFEQISFSHVPRELNKVADGLVNETLDNQTS